MFGEVGHQNNLLTDEDSIRINFHGGLMVEVRPNAERLAPQAKLNNRLLSACLKFAPDFHDMIGFNACDRVLAFSNPRPR